jgi:hypothetical protein
MFSQNDVVLLKHGVNLQKHPENNQGHSLCLDQPSQWDGGSYCSIMLQAAESIPLRSYAVFQCALSTDGGRQQ